MTKEQKEAIDRLKRIDIKYFISGRMEESNYIIDEADKTNEAIETVLSMLEEQEKTIDLMSEKIYKEGIVWDNKEEVKQYFENKAKEVE